MSLDLKKFYEHYDAYKKGDMGELSAIVTMLNDKYNDTKHKMREAGRIAEENTRFVEGDQYIEYVESTNTYERIPDDAYTLKQAYIKSLSTLSDGGDTNAWMTDGYELILARAGKIISLNKIRDDQRAGNYAALEAESYRKLKMRNAGYSASKVRSTEF